MSHTFDTTPSAGDRTDPSATVSFAMSAFTGNTGSAPETVIHRRADGSINHDHYDRVARNLRAHDQRIALKHLIAPACRLFRTVWPRTPARHWPSHWRRWPS